MKFTDEELKAIREERNRMNRQWWQRMTPEQRRQKRMEYTLNRAIRRKNTVAEEST